MSYLKRVAICAAKAAATQGANSAELSLILEKLQSKIFDKELGRLLSAVFGSSRGFPVLKGRRPPLKGSSSEAQKKKIRLFFARNPDIYGQYISAAEKKGLGCYEKDIQVPITKKVLQNVSEDYIIYSILHTSVYNNDKKVSKDAIEYAWATVKKNALLKDPYLLRDVNEIYTNEQELSPTIRRKVRKWWRGLTDAQQRKLLDDVSLKFTENDKENPIPDLLGVGSALVDTDYQPWMPAMP